MAVKLILSQVVGQAFIVSPEGELTDAKPSVQVQTGDMISVPAGKNAWLVADDQEQVDVLDETLLVGEEGLEGFDLPADIMDIISSIEEGEDPTQKEGTETAAGEEAGGSALSPMAIIEANAHLFNGISAGFDTEALSYNGVSLAQLYTLSGARSGSGGFTTSPTTDPGDDSGDAANDPDTTTTTSNPSFRPLDVDTQEDEAIILSLDKILSSLDGANSGDFELVSITPTIAGARVHDNGNGTFSLIPPEDYHGELSFTVELTDGTTTVTGEITSTVASVDDIPEITITPVELVEREQEEGDVVATFTALERDGEDVTVTITNDPEGYFKLLDNQVVLTQAGVDAVADERLDLTELSLTLSITDGITVVEETATIPVTRIDNDAIVTGDTTATVDEGTDAKPGTASGTLVISDPDSNDATTIDDASLTGEYGQLELVDGVWTYTVDKESVAALGEGDRTTDTFTITASDGSSHEIVITVAGTNDPAQISGDITGTVLGSDGEMSTSGQLSSNDVDGQDNVFIAETVETLRGELTIDENGAWSYSTNDPTGAIKALAEGETISEIVIVRAEDGTEQQIVITLEGVNDAPVFSAILTRDVYETNDVVSVDGTLNIVDPDAGQSFMVAGTYIADYGSLTIDRAGNWTYTSDPTANSTLDSLADGEKLLETITVRSLDGSEAEIVVTIIGTNDPAEIIGDITGTMIEADGTMTTNGQLESTDVDGNANTFIAETVVGRWGEVTINEDGSWVYSSDDSKGAINRLGEGDQLTDTITVRAEDGTPQQITITIDGTNDAAVFGAMLSGTLTEGDGQLSTSGRATVTDADYGEYFFDAGTYTGEYGEIGIDRAGNWTYTTDPAQSSVLDGLDAGELLTDTVTIRSLDGTTQEIEITFIGTNDVPVVSGEFSASIDDVTDDSEVTATGELTITDADSGDTPTFENTNVDGNYGSLTLVDGTWTYTLDKESASNLNAGETATDTITLTASDGTRQDIVITITGTDDAAVVSGDTTGGVTEGSDTLTASGTIAITDADAGDTPVFADTTQSGTYGSLTLVDGTWTYTLNPDAAQSLGADETTTDTITLTASDGTRQDIVITITGTDDAAVVSGETTGGVTEGSDTLTASGTIAITDADSGDTPVFADTTQSGTYGSLTLVDGAWTYTLNPDAAQSLGADETTTDTITLTASDGTRQDIVITITGTDDAAVVSGDTTGGVTEGSDTLTASGTIAITDADAGDTPVFANTTQSGTYGSLTLVDGAWTYTLNPDAAQFLGTDETTTDTITLTASDGTRQDIVITITGTDDAAVVSGDTTGGVTEGSDTLTASGTIAITDADAGDTPVFADTTQSGTYGSLTLVDGAWTYTLNPDAAQFLGTDETTTDTITLTASDGTRQDIVITITGTDDAAVVSGDTTGGVTEGSDTLTASGTIAITDADAGDTPVFADTTQSGTYGSLTLVDGAWTYTLNPDAAQFLGTDETTTDTITLTASDGTRQDIVITITGTDDEPVVSGDTTGAVTEADTGDTVTATGTLSISDVDTTDTPTFANTTVGSAFGSLALADGNWTYTLDPAISQSLNQGQIVTDTITLTATDGTKQDIVITVTGTDDAAVVSGSTSGSISADAASAIMVSHAFVMDENFSFDSGELHTFDFPPSLTFADSGTTVEFNDNDARLDGDSRNEYSDDNTQSIVLDGISYDANFDYTLQYSDAYGNLYTLAIVDVDTDSNGNHYDNLDENGKVLIQIDGPEILPGTSLTLVEDSYNNINGLDYADIADPITVSGSINISDVDSDDNPEFADTTIAGEFGSLTLTDGEWVYTLDPEAARSVNEGDEATDTITLVASDGTRQDIVITITGTDDAPEVSGDTTGAITEGSNTLTATGTIAITDSDSGDTPVFANTTENGAYGSLTLVDGAWTYTLNPDAAQSLGADETATDTITLTASDGTRQDIVITITGTDDAAVVSGETTGGVTEGSDTLTASGTISITDADANDTPVFANTTQSGTYGSLTLVDGAWTYTLDQTAAQSLGTDETATDTITLTASDGTTQDIVITITGTDDAAVVSGDTSAAIDLGAISPTANDAGFAQTGSDSTVSFSLADYATDVADDASNTDDKVTTIQITSLPEGGTLYYLDENGDRAEVGLNQILLDDTAFEFEPTLADATFTASDITSSTQTQIVTDGISVSGATYSGGKPDSSSTLSDAALVFDSAENETGLGIGTDNELNQSAKEVIVVDFGDDVNVTEVDIQVGSLWGHFQESGYDATPTILAFKDGVVVGEYAFPDLYDTTGEAVLNIANTEGFDELRIFNESEVGNSNFTLQGITVNNAEPNTDFTYQAIDSDGNLSDVGTVTLGSQADVTTAPESGPITVSGNIAISDVDSNDTPAFANTTATGTYGSLTLVDGTWTYTLNPDAAQSIGENETATDTITLTASDGTTQDIVISITGTNEAPVVSGDTTGGVTEGSAIVTATGSIAITDADTGDTPTFANTTQNGSYGSLTLVDGNWTYTLDPTAAQSLNENETAIDTITLTASDGTTQDIVITITGTDAAATVAGDTTGGVTEGSDTLTASGSISITDVDTGDNPVFADTTVNGNYGSLVLSGGEWTYTLDQATAQSLPEGVTATDTLLLTASDGTEQEIVITITGSDDAAVISGDVTGQISDFTPNTQTVSVGRSSDGTYDVSNGDSLSVNISGISSSAGYNNSLGYYVLDAGGNVIRAAVVADNVKSVSQVNLDIDTSGGEKLGLFLIPNGDNIGFNNGAVNLSFSGSVPMVSQGGASSQAFVSESNKNGSGFDYENNSGSYSAWEDLVGGGDRDFNDLVFNITASESQTQDITTSGSITISDPDAGENPTIANTTIQGEYGSLTLTNGNWTYTLDPNTVLGADDETTDTITLTASDGSAHEIVIHIEGTDDAPVVSGIFTGAVTEGGLSDIITASGTLSISDVDNNDTPEFADTIVEGNYGSLSLTDGNWTYTLDPVKSQSLSEGQIVTETLTLTASDGTVQNITLSVTGSDDQPLITGTASGSVVAPNEITDTSILVGNAFILGDGVSTSSGHFQYVDQDPPAVNFSKSATTVRFIDTDSRLDGDNWNNEYTNDTSQNIEMNGVEYSANYDYSIQYRDGSGNIYTFAVLDVDFDRDGNHIDDSAEWGKVLIQLDGPTIYAGTSLTYVAGSTDNTADHLNYNDIAVSTASVTTSGSLAISDVDSDSTPVFSDTTIGGNYGSLVLEGGNWTYTLDPRSTPELESNQAISDTITVTATDGTQQDIVINIGGSQSALSGLPTSTLTDTTLSDLIAQDDITYLGDSSNETIEGSDTTDVILGQAGQDNIFGGAGTDFLDGGLGDDLITGGKGNDFLAGNQGSDTFAFLRGDEGTEDAPAVDHIVDFDADQDTVNLADLLQGDTQQTLEEYLSLEDDGEGHATLNISSHGDGTIDQQVVFDNMSVSDMANAYDVDISGMTGDQISTSVIDAMIIQARMVVD